MALEGKDVFDPVFQILQGRFWKVDFKEVEEVSKGFLEKKLGFGPLLSHREIPQSGEKQPRFS